MAALWRTFVGSSLALNLTSVAGAMVLSRLIGLLTLGYTARVFGPHGYGLVGYGSTIVAYAGIALSPGLLTWGVRAVAQDRPRAGMYLVALNVTQVGLAALAYLALVAFALLAVPGADERHIIYLSGLVLFQTALAADWVFNGLEQIRIAAFLGLLTTALSTAGLLLFIHTPQDVFRLPVMMFGITSLTTALCYWLLSRRIAFAWPSAQDFKAVWMSARSLSLMVALVVVVHYANNLLVQGYLGTAELGVFLAAFRLLELASTVPGLVSTVVLPRLARKLAATPEEAKREARTYARVLLLFGALAAALSLVEADGIIAFIYGNRFTGAAPLLRVMAVGIFFNFAITGYTNTLISFGSDRVMIAVVAVSALVAVGGGLVLVPRYGAMGGAMVIAAIDLAGFAVSVPEYRRKVGGLDFAGWLGPLLYGLGTIGLSLALQQLPLPLLVRLPLAALPFAVGGWRQVRAMLN